MNVVALAGGVGGARLAEGLSRALPADRLAVIVNVADDFELYGLKICPDLDTVCYTLAGMANAETGWGRSGETWNALNELARLGGPDWFRLGDRDLATHLERTRLLRGGAALSRVVACFCRAWGVGPQVLPVSDDPVATFVETESGWLPFQEYFVRWKYRPKVKGFRFEGVEAARPAPGVLEALDQAHLVVICPSNPWVSVDPILAVAGIRDGLTRKPVVAVSPIVAGRAIKGPAAKMFSELGVRPSAEAVARHYGARAGGGLLSGFVLDSLDHDQARAIDALGVRPLITNTLMRTPSDRLELACNVLAFGEQLIGLDRKDR